MTDSASARFSSSALSSATAAGSSSTRTARSTPAPAAARAPTAPRSRPISAPTRRPRQLSGNARTRADRPLADARIAAQVGGRRTPRRAASPSSATRSSAGPISGVRPRSASTDSCPDRSDETTAQHGAGTHVAARSTSSSAIFGGLERRVDGADDVEQRVAPLDAAAQRALKHAQPARPDRGRMSRAGDSAPRFAAGARAADRRHGLVGDGCRRATLRTGWSLDSVQTCGYGGLAADGWPLSSSMHGKYTTRYRGNCLPRCKFMAYDQGFRRCPQ